MVHHRTATITAAGGKGPYTYSLQGQTDNSTGCFPGLAAGTYTYSVTDGNGCAAATGSVTIGQPAAITATSASTDASCHGIATGTATITAAGGTGPYTYSLQGQADNNTGAFPALQQALIHTV